jgi:hypothetical protein
MTFAPGRQKPWRRHWSGTHGYTRLDSTRTRRYGSPRIFSHIGDIRRPLHPNKVVSVAYILFTQLYMVVINTTIKRPTFMYRILM